MKDKEKKVMSWKIALYVGIGIVVAVVLTIITSRVIKRYWPDDNVEKRHERTVAPTEEEKKELDDRKDEVKKQTEAARENDGVLTNKKEDLDSRKANLDAMSEETDRAIKEAENHDESGENSSPVVADPDLVRRLRERRRHKDRMHNE